VFWLTSLDRRQLLYVSPSYEQVFGDSCENLMKAPGRWLDAIHPEDQARIRALMASPEPRAYEMEFRIVRPDGAVRWIHDRVSVVRDQSGKPTSIGGVAEDVTDRRVLQQEFERAQRMESVGQLAGGVAHDFNNLLTVISTSAHCLKRETGALKPEYNDLCEEIEQAVLRATALTRQLLAFSRQEVVTPVALDVNELVRSTEKMLRRLLGEDVGVLTVLGAEQLRVRADPGQLVQVLLNLAVNARDAMPEGGRLVLETSQVTVGLSSAQRRLTARPGEYVRLSVTDTGCGMTPEVQSHIFEPFYSTKAAGKGTGLGLAVVFGVVEQAGGLIDVVSAPGAGATFHIYLPVCTACDEDAEGAKRTRAEEAGNETVLLVEDDDAVRRAAARGLREHGYRVLEAANANLALESLASGHPIDMLITDVVMPGLDGRRLAEQATQKRPGLKTLFVSGYTDDAVVRYGVFQSEVEFLHKPFSPASLARKVRQVLDGRRS
jgi:PAS domain S-box-containing protein